MIKFENTETYGWEAAIRGMRNPMNSWHKSDTTMALELRVGQKHGRIYAYIGENDMKLMKNLVSAGTDHGKFMRMITVTVDITAPMYFLKELDTYKVGTVRNSCSTMHKIMSKEFEFEDFSCEHLYAKTKSVLKDVIIDLNELREMYLNGNFTSDQKKHIWYNVIQMLPSSYNQRSTVQLNYQVLRNIYFSRKDHKLDEWHDFCAWIKSLPYSELITEPSAIVPEWIKIEPDEEGLYTCNLPDEGQEVLFCKKNGEIFIDELCCDGFYDDGSRMAYVGNGYDLDDIAAWMPLPKPYKARIDEEGNKANERSGNDI